MLISHINGHKVFSEDNGESWFYEDGLNAWKVPYRKCPRCGHTPTSNGNDYCISDLPGVKFACCGHGVEKGYIMFEDGTCVRGKFKIERK